jgi:RNA polymerase sigma factor (sigma-70 family)
VTDWILKIKTNENKAFKEIYMLCREDCLAWLQKEYGCDQEDALDIFQMSVLILYDNIITGKLQNLTSHIKTYIMGIARNKALELYRNKKNVVNDDILQNIAEYISAEDTQINEEQLVLAGKALDELGDPCKTVLIQYYYHDKSMEEITTMMQYKNSDTTKNQKYKCLKRLQSIFFSHTLKSQEN